MGVSLLDLVTEHQSGEENTLRKVLEHSGKDFDVSEASKPVELDESIYLWETRDDIPEDLPDGTYVIIDAMYFSTSAIELFERGLKTLRLCASHDEVRSLDNVDLKIGEGRNEEQLKEGMDLINSPSYIVENYQGEENAAMISYNGARAALRVIEATENSRILIGSATNASTLADELEDDDIHLVSAGSDGVHQAEDHIAAYIITQEIHEDLEESERKMLQKMIDLTADLHYDSKIPERRQKDTELLNDINERSAVPEFDRDKQVFRPT